jgi:hypothetical protein
METWDIAHRIVVWGLIALALPFPIVLTAASITWLIASLAAIAGLVDIAEKPEANRQQG